MTEVRDNYLTRKTSQCIMLKLATLLLTILVSNAAAFTPLSRPFRTASAIHSTTDNKNVEQTENTSREKVMTFSYDMSIEPKYDKPTYPGTGNGLSGDSGEYDVVSPDWTTGR